MTRRWLLILFITLLPGLAHAHKPSDSYISLAVDKTRISGQWDIALRDLDYAIGLDGNDDGLITWGELRNRRAAIDSHLLPRLAVRANQQNCPLRVTELLVDEHSDGAYAVLRLRAECPGAINHLALGYRLFFDLDPTHRGLLNLRAQGATRTAIFSPAHATQHFALGHAPARLRQFGEFVREGVWHIAIGFDHVLFLLSLLLPAVLRREQGRWQAVAELRPACWSVVKIVTAFTLAHSLTLSLAALGIVQLPARLVESAIAASIILAALNNIYPLVQRRLWLVAFGFGLIHGFGFANVLVDLGLPQQALLLALAGFNIGVELGQLGIVGVFLPLAYLLRRSWFYRRVTLAPGSLAIALLASVWLVERAFDLSLVSAFSRTG